MDRTKKDRPKAATFGQSCPGLASTNIRKIIIPNFQRIASPNLDRGGGTFHIPGLDPGLHRRGLSYNRIDAYH